MQPIRLGSVPGQTLGVAGTEKWTPTQTPLRGTEARTGTEAYTDASLQTRIGDTKGVVNARTAPATLEPSRIPSAPSENPCLRKDACRSRTYPSIPYS